MTTYPTHTLIDGETHAIVKIDEHPDGPHHTHRVHLACGLTVDVDVGGVRKHARHLERAREHVMPEWQVKHTELAQQALDDGETWEQGHLGGEGGDAGAADDAARQLDAAEVVWAREYAKVLSVNPTSDPSGVDPSILVPAGVVAARDAARAAHAQAVDAYHAGRTKKRHDRWARGAAADCGHCAAYEEGTREAHSHEGAHTRANTRHADIGTGLPCPTCGAQLYIRRQGGEVACSAQGHVFKVEEALATGMGLLHKLATGAAEFKDK